MTTSCSKRRSGAQALSLIRDEVESVCASCASICDRFWRTTTKNCCRCHFPSVMPVPASKLMVQSIEAGPTVLSADLKKTSAGGCPVGDAAVQQRKGRCRFRIAAAIAQRRQHSVRGRSRSRFRSRNISRTAKSDEAGGLPTASFTLIPTIRNFIWKSRAVCVGRRSSRSCT